MRSRNKGMAQLVPLAIGIIVLAAGVTLMFIIPEYLIYTLNQTATFDETALETATTKVNTVRNIGMAVIIIALVWVIIAVISGAGAFGGKT